MSYYNTRRHGPPPRLLLAKDTAKHPLHVEKVRHLPIVITAGCRFVVGQESHGMIECYGGDEGEIAWLTGHVAVFLVNNTTAQGYGL